MKVLAVIEDKNRRLRAYLPDFISPFMACMTKYCSVHDAPNFANTNDYVCAHELETGSSASCNYVTHAKEHSNIFMLIDSDVLNETEGTNIAVTSENHLVLSISIDELFRLFGRKQITSSTSWSAFLARFTQAQLLQAAVNLPIPLEAVDIHARSTRGLAQYSEEDEMAVWTFPDGHTSFHFGQNLKRPYMYTLNDIPGIKAHFGSKTWAGIQDEIAFANNIKDIILEKDVSAKVTFSKCVPIVNGLMYFPSTENNLMYIQEAVELFWNQPYQYASIALLDFSEMIDTAASVACLKLSDCTLNSVVQDGCVWRVSFNVPNASSLTSNTPFLSFDGRWMTFDKISIIGANTLLLTLTETEIRFMKERDMQLTEKFAFNTNILKPTNGIEYWIRAQFNQVSAAMIAEAKTDLSTTYDGWSTLSSTVQNTLATNYAMEWLASPKKTEGANPARSFLFFVPNTSIYFHEYRMNSRLNYNGILIRGKMVGMLQSLRGQEFFEHTDHSYYKTRTLESVNSEKPSLVAGSESHILVYAPYEFLTTLEKPVDDNTLPNITVASDPYIERIAPEAVVHNPNEFRLLDIVSLS